MATIQGNITATGATSTLLVGARFNFSLGGFGTATVALERSFDNGSTWGVVEEFTSGVERLCYEHEPTLYRLNCTAYTSGTITYRLRNVPV